MSIRRSVLGIIVLAAIAIGCEAAAQQAAPIVLEGTGWRAVEVDGQSMPAGQEPTVSFRGGRIIGSGGCNTFAGDFRLVGGAPSIGELQATLKVCEGPAGETEVAFMRALVSANAVSLADPTELTLDGPGGAVRFVAAAPAE